MLVCLDVCERRPLTRRSDRSTPSPPSYPHTHLLLVTMLLCRLMIRELSIAGVYRIPAASMEALTIDGDGASDVQLVDGDMMLYACPHTHTPDTRRKNPLLACTGADHRPSIASRYRCCMLPPHTQASCGQMAWPCHLTAVSCTWGSPCQGCSAGTPSMSTPTTLGALLNCLRALMTLTSRTTVRRTNRGQRVVFMTHDDISMVVKNCTCVVIRTTEIVP